MATAPRDQNNIATLLGVSNVDGSTPVVIYADPVTHRLLVDLPGGSGTVTTVSVATANGFAGSVSNPTTTPAITISTTVTGILKGNGTAVSAAASGTDYAPATSGTSILKGDGSGGFANAIAGTDYVTASSTNTFTNKTYDTAGTGNSFSINGVAVTANTGTGSVVRASSPTLVTPDLGTPSSGNLSACTGYTVGNLSGLGTGVGTWLATPTFTNLNSAVTGDSVVGLAATQTLTNKRITDRVTSISSSATPTINTDSCDAVTITALSANITSFTTNLSGTPTNFQKLIIRIKDDGTPRTISWGASFASYGTSLPTTTTTSKVLTVGFIWDSVASLWGCVASQTQP